MCGIAGLIQTHNTNPEDVAIVERMIGAQTHRGPDDSGVWVDPDGRCALSHRRLSIIDTSSAGHQPMISRSGQAAITFNGVA